jgi:hypothetical protein
MAFGSHVHQTNLDAASEAGFDQVVSNGQFNEMLSGLFSQD